MGRPARSVAATPARCTCRLPAASVSCRRRARSRGSSKTAAGSSPSSSMVHRALSAGASTTWTLRTPRIPRRSSRRRCWPPSTAKNRPCRSRSQRPRRTSAAAPSSSRISSVVSCVLRVRTQPTSRPTTTPWLEPSRSMPSSTSLRVAASASSEEREASVTNSPSRARSSWTSSGALQRCNASSSSGSSPAQARNSARPVAVSIASSEGSDTNSTAVGPAAPSTGAWK